MDGPSSLVPASVPPELDPVEPLLEPVPELLPLELPVDPLLDPDPEELLDPLLDPDPEEPLDPLLNPDPEEPLDPLLVLDPPPEEEPPSCDGLFCPPPPLFPQPAAIAHATQGSPASVDRKTATKIDERIAPLVMLDRSVQPNDVDITPSR